MDTGTCNIKYNIRNTMQCIVCMLSPWQALTVVVFAISDTNKQKLGSSRVPLSNWLPARDLEGQYNMGPQMAIALSFEAAPAAIVTMKSTLQA